MEPRAEKININYYINYLLDMHGEASAFPEYKKYKNYYKKELEKRAEYLSYRTYASLQENNRGFNNFYNRIRYGFTILKVELSKKIKEKFLKES
jgi:hypothetical protein